jgi:hypothetical protein
VILLEGLPAALTARLGKPAAAAAFLTLDVISANLAGAWGVVGDALTRGPRATVSS